MRLGVLVYRTLKDRHEADLVWLDSVSGRVLQTLSVPFYSNIKLISEHNFLLVTYTEYSEDSPARESLDVYRLSDRSLRARLELTCRAHFNVMSWSPFISYPDKSLVYMYSSRTLGHHLAEDFISVFDLANMRFVTENYRLPDCVAGWSASGGDSVAQMLFVADGLSVGRLPAQDLDQKVAFWLGPEGGMGPSISLGPRPRIHSDLGHARAILFAPGKQLSVVVCTDGTVHLVDPVQFLYIERQQVSRPMGFAMPIFAAQLDPHGRLLYVGMSNENVRRLGVSQRIVVHDLELGKQIAEIIPHEPFIHFVLSNDGGWLYGAGVESGHVYVIKCSTGEVESRALMPGFAQYLFPGG